MASMANGICARSISQFFGRYRAASPVAQQNATQGDNQRGAALVYVLTLVTLIGLLVGLTWRTISINNSLAASNRGEVQARLLGVTGLELALAKIGPAGADQNLGFNTESLIYRLDGDAKTFDLRVRSWGLFARIRSLGKTSRPPPGRSREATGIVGQALDLGRLPALGLLNHEGNMVLAGNAQVTGPILLWRGDVRKATDYHVRWTGTVGHSGPVWDSTALAWDLVNPDFGRAEAWMNSQAELLLSHDFTKDFDFDSTEAGNIILPDSSFLVDTVMVHARILAGKILRLGSGVRLRECKIMAPEIRIESDAELDRVLAFAGKNLQIQGGHFHGGQYLAGDSLSINSDLPMDGYPFFYVRGRIKNRGKLDSSMVGSMVLRRVRGEGIFLAPLLGKPMYDQEIRMVVNSGVQITGLLYCSGHVQMEGQLRGSLICKNLKFEYKGTIWLGHLKDAHISSLSGRRVITAPLLFPGFSPIIFGESR
jgi:hypothetical protein